MCVSSTGKGPKLASFASPLSLLCQPLSLAGETWEMSRNLARTCMKDGTVQELHAMGGRWERSGPDGVPWCPPSLPHRSLALLCLLCAATWVPSPPRLTPSMRLWYFCLLISTDIPVDSKTNFQLQRVIISEAHFQVSESYLQL